MLGEIGRIADGGLPLLFPPEHYRNVMPHIVAGAQAANRDIDQLDIAACIWCSISNDKHRAEDALKEKIAYYGHALSPLIWDRLGLTQEDFRPIEQAMMGERDSERATRLVDARMLRIGVVGAPRDVISRLEPLVAAGVEHLSFGPPLGPAPLAAISLLGAVVRHFRG